ncbi:GspE/PulE family protein [Oligoflexia bacterium]|nr:GspE/PulE family protein [Oligoflexia bacterium]
MAKKRKTAAEIRAARQQSGARPVRKENWKPSIEEDLKDLIADHEKQEDDQAVEVDEALQGADAPLVRLVNSIIHEAIKREASDIHIEPFENLIRIRFRVDGVLHEVQQVPHKLGSALVSRIKIMADLDICERRIPQDGVIRFRMQDAGGDLRVSTLPSTYGENIVMRVLGTTNLNNDLAKLGIPSSQIKIFRNAISKPNGLVLVTGPTGSGKTTTLYAALNELNDISVGVFTAEDPVEGTLPGVTQCQVNNAVGFTFSAMLRSFLRQDPDVILVGEIRDRETAEIAIKASLTGHLVLSTLHTNCSISTIQRLINIGVPAYLITSSINCIVAQRLVRRICEHCKEQRPVSDEMLDSLGLSPATLKGSTVCYGRGCDQCHGSGFLGRVPVYEILVLTDELRGLILKGAAKSQLKHVARLQGLRTLRDSGLQLVKQGVTTIEEVLGRTAEDDEYEEQNDMQADKVEPLDHIQVKQAEQPQEIKAAPAARIATTVALPGGSAGGNGQMPQSSNLKGQGIDNGFEIPSTG